MEECRDGQRAISISREEGEGIEVLREQGPRALPETNSVNISNDALKGYFDVIYVV